jgi:hypothetical protein
MPGVNEVNFLVSIAAQVPIVAIFIWFTLKIQDKSDQMVQRRDEQWRKFLEESEKRSMEAYMGIVSELKEVATCVALNRDILVAHDKGSSVLAAQVRTFMDDLSPHSGRRINQKDSGG